MTTRGKGSCQKQQGKYIWSELENTMINEKSKVHNNTTAFVQSDYISPFDRPIKGLEENIPSS